MPLRSVIDIDVNDDAFRAFHTLFEKYSNVLDKMPGAWGKVNQAQQQTRSTFVEMAAALMAQQELLRRSEREVEKIDHTVRRTYTSMQNLTRATREFAGNLLSATGTIMKWSGITGVVGSMIGLLSGEGISHLAGRGAAMYRTSMGYAGPTTPAQVGAAGAYGGVLDPHAVLSQLTEMLSTAEGKRGLVSLGFGPGDWSKGAGGLLPEFLRRLQGMSKNILGSGYQYNYGDIMSGQGLGGFAETGRVLSRMTPQQLEEMERSRIRAERELAQMNEEVLERWAKLKGTFDVAGTKIESAFITALDKLADPIGRVVEAFSGAVAAFGSSKEVATLMEGLATGLKNVDVDDFAKRVGEGARKLVELGTSLTMLIGKIATVLGWLGDNSSLGSDNMKGDAQRGMLGWGAAGAFLGNMFAGPRGAVVGGTIGAAVGGVVSTFTGQPRSNKWTGPMPEGKAPPGQSFNPSSYSSGDVDPSILTGIQFFEERGLTRAQSIGLVMRLASESGGGKRLDPNAFNSAGGGQGAYGVAQWRGTRQPAARATNGDLTSQLWLVWNELNSTHRNALDLIKNSGNSADAARNAEQYELARNPDFTELAAKRAYAMQNRLPSSGPLTGGGGGSPTIWDRLKSGIFGSSAPAAGGRTPEQVKQILAKYTPQELAAHRKHGSIGRDGVPLFPPGTPINSSGESYAQSLLDMPSDQRRTNEKRMSEWTAEFNRVKAGGKNPFDQSAEERVRVIQKSSGIKVTIEHDVGGSAASGAAQAQ
jgi:hypothetical protein